MSNTPVIPAGQCQRHHHFSFSTACGACQAESDYDYLIPVDPADETQCDSCQ